MARFKRVFKFLALAALAGTLLGVLSLVGLYLYIAPDLPEVQQLRDVHLQVPLRVYSRDGRLIGQFGEVRRIPVTFEDTPELLIQAITSAEDDRFFVHPGVDWQGLARAFYYFVRSGGSMRHGGGSTITMQVARNTLITRERSYLRKFREIFLALAIERELSKEEVMELYLNKMFLGQRAYGVAAAAEVYYGKTVQELTLGEMATIAGLYQLPSTDNPVTSPERAQRRRAYVLRRLLENEYISQEQHDLAAAEPVATFVHASAVELDAPYLAEMVRAEMLSRYGNSAFTEGYRVTATIDSRLQRGAEAALRSGLMEYDRRHGYRGPLGTLPLTEVTPDPESAEAAAEADPATAEVDPDTGRPDLAVLAAMLGDYADAGHLIPVVVLGVDEVGATALTEDGALIDLPWAGLSWAREFIDDEHAGSSPTVPTDVVSAGDVVLAELRADGLWWLAQVPLVQGALVSIDPQDGAVVALVGGFDFQLSKFNRVTQARRQPGSSFKPFIYSSAIADGFTAASVINDAPVVFEDASLETTWRPENFSERFFGPTRMREALVNSRNMVSIRLLQATGVRDAVDHILGYGFDEDSLPHDLSLALGSATLTPLEMAHGYSVLANTGYQLQDHFIDRIEDVNREPMYIADPPLVCPDCAGLPTLDEVLAAQRAAVPEAVDGVPAPAGSQAIRRDTVTVTSVTSATSVATVTDDPMQQAVRPDFPIAVRTVDERVNYIVVDMMQDVVRRGTGRRAMALGRNDLAGKTGTTNDEMDAWFSGFNPIIQATAWVGFDQQRTLGRGEVGGRAALPMWIEFMRGALANVPDVRRDAPEGLVTVRIDRATGKLAPAGASDAVFEIFRAEFVPTEIASDSAGDASVLDETDDDEDDEDSLF
jgi:penicillin-binding protein 1A